MNQFNTLNIEEQNESIREWNRQLTSSQFKSRTSPLNTSPVVSVIMGRLNHHVIDNGDVEAHPTDFPVKFNSGYVPNSATIQLYTFIVVKLTISWNYSTQNMMKIFCMLISKCFRIAWCLTVLQNLYSLYCVVLLICRSKNFSNIFHVTLFYICPYQGQCETV